MPEKDPSNYSLLTYGWMLMLAVWGGIVHNIRKVREGLVPHFSLTELIGDVFTSGFAGIITFYLCESAGMNQLMTAALVGVSGHMGARAIFFFEEFLRNQFSKK